MTIGAYSRSLVAVLLLSSTTPSSAQTISGRVLEEGSEQPVSTALVRLVDGDGDVRADVLSDSGGNFVLAPPEAGEYYLEAQRIGYEPSRSPLLALTMDGSASVDLLVRPAPVGLEGFEVTAERRVIEELRHYGVRPELLGNRLITREDIAAPPFKRDIRSIFTWNPIPGLRIRTATNRSGAPTGLCLYFRRGVDFSPSCGVVVLNGMEISSEVLTIMDPTIVEVIAVLTPFEAQTLYGHRGEAGAIMIWTGVPWRR